MPLNHNEGNFGQKSFLSTDVNVLCMSWLLGSGLPLSLSLPPSLPSLSYSKGYRPTVHVSSRVDIMSSNWNNFTSTMFGSCINCTESHTHSTPTHAHSLTYTRTCTCMRLFSTSKPLQISYLLSLMIYLTVH